MNQNIYQDIGGMVSFVTSIIAAKFILNDVPHILGLTKHTLTNSIGNPSVAGTVGWYFDKAKVPYSHLYHFTLEKNISSIMAQGLVPSQQLGLFTGMVEEYIPERRGLYLATSKEMAYDLLEDYEYREERIPGVYSLLKVYLPESWPVIEDRHTLMMGYNPAALISYTPIPPDKMEIANRFYYTISEPGKIIREVPPMYGGIGCRVRHLPTGKEGKLTGFGPMTSEKTELKVLFNEEADFSMVDEKELVALIS